MDFNKRSAAVFPIVLLQKVIGWSLVAVCVALVILFGLQFPHSEKLDATSFIFHLRLYGDPFLAEIAPWMNSKWPPAASSFSFIPLVVAMAVWGVRLGVNAVFTRLRKLVTRLVPAGKSKAAPISALTLEAEEETVGADSEHAREQLLKRYREIEDRLKAAKRKRCAFLSVDIVGSTQMKVGEREASISATFQAYEEMAKKVFKQYGAWKQAWTPDGVMVCFLQVDLAVAAGLNMLQRLKKFNDRENKLRTPFRLRCGVNEGEVQIFEDSKLEKVVDRVIDVAGHMQKEARPNSLWMGEEVYRMLADKTDLHLFPREVDGYKVYEWCPDPVPVVVEATSARAGTVVAGTSLMSAAAAASGTLRAGRYEILQELGRGAMGAVYKARDPQIDRIVAIKVIMVGNQPPEVLEDYKQRFYREAKTAGKMSHPGIVTIYDMSEDAEGNPYLVMEFIEGKTLDRMLVPGKPDSLSEPMPVKRKLDISSQVADALDYAHRRNVIHRDIKPANILVTTEGRAKIADFGIAKMEGTHMTQTGMLVGTPAFMSPEQITGGDVDSRSDIFSFGVMVYWMLTGKRPFPGDAITQIAYKVVHADPPPIRQLNPNLPAEIEPILLRCLAKKPADRYPNAGEIVTALEAVKAKLVLASAPVSSTPESTG